MSMRIQLRDAATALDDFIEEAGLPEENWLDRVEATTDIDAADALMDIMRFRLVEIFEPMPYHTILVTLGDSFAGYVGRLNIKGATPRMAMRMVQRGLENSGIDYKSIRAES